MVLTNDLIWLVPFGLILYNAYKHPYLLDNEMLELNDMSVEDLSQLYVTNAGNTLYDLSQEKPVMLIFLRHFGCIFCKDTLYSIQQLRASIEAKGTRIVLVNMLGEEKSREELVQYQLDDLEYISDPECMLYKGFKLKRGTLTQLLGFKIWLRVLQVWFSKRVFNSSSRGMDVFQMPGIFLLFKGKVVKKYVHETAADIPPYLELATCETCNY
jgi:peroxiredoxin